MTIMKIIMMGSREDEAFFAEEWAKENNVDLTITNDVLNNDTYHLLSGFDGISLQQTMGIPKEMYARLKQDGFKQISQRSAGVDMYDLDEASKQGIIITNVPAYSPNAISEFAVTSALNCLRHTELIQSRMKQHDFTWNKPILSKEMRSQRVGILGTGRIGQISAQIFKGFRAEVVGYDLYKNDNARKYLTYVESFDEFLGQCDIISIHMPLTKDNHHLFNDETFAKMKPGAILVNSARGAIVDTQALLRALDSQQLSACALDTYENEMPYVTKDWSDKPLEDEVLETLINHPDVIYTPHIAFYTETAVENLVSGCLSSCLDILTTGTTANIVNP